MLQPSRDPFHWLSNVVRAILEEIHARHVGALMLFFFFASSLRFLFIFHSPAFTIRLFHLEKKKRRRKKDMPKRESSDCFVKKQLKNQMNLSLARPTTFSFSEFVFVFCIFILFLGNARRGPLAVGGGGSFSGAIVYETGFHRRAVSRGGRIE